LILTVPDIEAADPLQLTLPPLDDGLGEDAPLDGLIDRLGARLGFQQVCRFRLCESLLPEYAIEFRPVTVPVMPHAKWPENRARPVRLIDPPMRLEVSAMLPEESPVQFRIGREMHRVVTVEGPERLTPEWWRDQSLPWQTRDYYRIEDDKGARFWIFHERRQGLWYLHGHLP
jgi:protein ImuB